MRLAEALVALAITLVAVAAALRLADAAGGAATRLPEALDVQQRARVGVDAVARDLAAAGLRRRPGVPGPPAVLPLVLGVSGDAPGAARGDAITLLSVPATSPAGVLATPLSAATPQLRLSAGGDCGSAALCGLAAGDDVVIVDQAGAFDVVRIVSIAAGIGAVRQHGRSFSNAFETGARVWRVESRSYYLDRAAGILRQYDGDASDQPVADHLVDLGFAYYAADVSGALVELPLAQLADGPWIGAGSSMYDVDWQRVRAVRVRIGAQAATAELRRVVPAVSLELLVAPRALGVGAA